MIIDKAKLGLNILSNLKFQKKIYLKNFTSTILCLLLISACSDSNNAIDEEIIIPTPDPEINYDNSLQEFSEFEGKSITLTSTLEADSYQWQQVSGPEISLENANTQEITLDIPWVDKNNQLAEFMVTVTLDGQSVEQPINLNILNRRYLVLNIENEEASNLFIDYIAANDNDGVPDVNITQLTNFTQNEKVCGYAMSPNGRYVAFTLGQLDSGLISQCSDITLVDIESLQTQTLTALGRDSTPAIISLFRWSNDSKKIIYHGDHGEAIFQPYVIDIETSSTSYLNYNPLVEIGTTWPEDDRFPISAGGNPFNLDTLNNTQVSRHQWLNSSNDVAFNVFDNESGDFFPYHASVHGTAIKLERNYQIAEEAFAYDTDGANEIFETCEANDPNDFCVISLTLPNLTAIERRYVNPEWIGSSVDGHYAFITTMVSNLLDPMKILSVRQPVVDGQRVITSSPIEATHVYDAAWSPTESDLAFASETNYRRIHSGISDGEISSERILNEIPGQLYLYNDYQQGHQLSHERLSRPNDAIDSNSVIKLDWSPDGQSIAYARGEETDLSAGFYTSLWINRLDDTFDSTSSVIDANTQLLDRVEGSDFYIDFKYSPNNLGVIALFRSDSTTRLRYFNLDASLLFDKEILVTTTIRDFSSLSASFSPQGDYFAYIGKTELSNGEQLPSIMVFNTSTGQSTFIQPPNVGSIEGISSIIQWSPHGDALIYSVRTPGSSEQQYYLARVDGLHEDWNDFLVEGQSIMQIRVDDFTPQTLFPGLP